MNVGDRYRHCKGKLYEIVCIARDSDDCTKEIVVYKSLDDSDFPIGTIWIRPIKEFTNNHRTGVKRFVKEKSNE